MKTMSWDEFEQQYKPILDDDGEIPKYLEPEDIKARGKIDPYHFWTYISDERDGLVPGLQAVNRIGYLECEIPWTNEDIWVELD